ncbi:MAG: hypothetical protein NWF11_02115 [Candidatus Bathyarchaeota archaeon]|nr:hypothetical protein [Candidatus Bathyarchaeota archaeon]
MGCKICDEKVVNHGFCRLHAKAYRNLMEKYEGWKDALNLSRREYLSEIIRNIFTGLKAKEVAEVLISEETE